MLPLMGMIGGRTGLLSQGGVAGVLAVVPHDQAGSGSCFIEQGCSPKVGSSSGKVATLKCGGEGDFTPPPSTGLDGLEVQRAGLTLLGGADVIGQTLADRRDTAIFP